MFTRMGPARPCLKIVVCPWPKKWCVHLHTLGPCSIQVEDIIDTGITLSKLVNYFTAKGSASVSVCVLLDKEARRKVPLKLGAGGKLYTGFKVAMSLLGLPTYLR